MSSEKVNKVYIEEFINTSLVDVVTSKIRSNIYCGKYMPGQRLVVREISDELGVSHTPVKDALNRLVAEGYVEAPPRKSMKVKEYSNSEFINNYEVRLMCELFCAEEIMKHAELNSGIVKDMEECQEAMKSVMESFKDFDYETWVNYETKFHRRYMQECSNSKVYSIYCSLDSNKQSYFAYLNNNRIPLKISTIQLNFEDHREIIEAIRALDAARFSKAVTHHLLRACEEYAVDSDSKKRLQSVQEKAVNLLK